MIIWMLRPPCLDGWEPIPGGSGAGDFQEKMNPLTKCVV